MRMPRIVLAAAASGSVEGGRIPGRETYEVRGCRDYGEPEPQLSESTQDWRTLWN